MKEEQKYEEKIINQKYTILLFLGIIAIIGVFGGLTYAFFNYTRTGSSNTLKVGTISFSSNYTDVTLTNVFPISSTDAKTDTTNTTSVTVNISGKTTYSGGVEYLVTLTDANVAVGNKTVPVSLMVTSSNLGENDDDYFDNRGGSTKIYKVLAKEELENNEQVLVGFIPNSETMTTGSVTIKVYLDSDKVAISDTYDGTESDFMGTTSVWIDDRVYLTTTEWNSLATTPISFKVKVEANEGTWVENPFPRAYRVIMKRINEKGRDDVSIYDANDGITYLSGSNEDLDFNYVWYSGKLWRVTSVYDDGTMKLITRNPMVAITYNKDNNPLFWTDNNTTSFAYQWLNEDFLDTLEDSDIFLETNKTWNFTQQETLGEKISTNNSSTIISSSTTKIGLLNSYEYYLSYNKASDKENGYLYEGGDFWLLTPVSSSALQTSRQRLPASYSMPAFIKPVIYLKSNSIFSGGNGSLNNPYIILTGKEYGKINDFINERIVGEYITFDGDTSQNKYRIVAFETMNNETVTKIVSDNFAGNGRFSDNSNTNVYGKYWTNQSGCVYYSLQTVLNNMSFPNKNSILVNGKYYMGSVSTTNGANYKLGVCAQETTDTIKNCSTTNVQNGNFKIGLLRYGEIFSAPRIERLIELHSYDSPYGFPSIIYLITPGSSGYVWSINYGEYGGVTANATYGPSVELPSFHVASNVRIIDNTGNGTLEHPYVVGL